MLLAQFFQSIADAQSDPAVADIFIQLTYIFCQASPSENR